MQGDGRRILAVPDHRNHLAAFALDTAGDERGEQRVTGAAAAQIVVDIDRVLDRESISRPQTVGRRIAVADHTTTRFGYEVWQAAVENVGATTAQLINAGRFLFE